MRADVWRADSRWCCDQWDRLGNLPAPRGSGSMLYVGSGAEDPTRDSSGDRLLYIGGIGNDGYAANDVFITADGARSWASMTTAPWAPRWNLNGEVTRDGIIIIAGGITNMPSAPNGLKDLNDVRH